KIAGIRPYRLQFVVAVQLFIALFGVICFVVIPAAADAALIITLFFLSVSKPDISSLTLRFALRSLVCLLLQLLVQCRLLALHILFLLLAPPFLFVAFSRFSRFKFSSFLGGFVD